MKRFDYPPVWLVGYLAVAWALARAFEQTVADIALLKPLAVIFLAVGGVLNVLAVLAMARAKTTVIPRKDPTALVTGGIFNFTRNPIYLGDIFFLAAGIFWWGSVSALPLLWLFKRTIERRFIEDEEIKMQQHFGKNFDRWASETRRWI